jgi:thiamine-phosphate pyrophosphorylase
MDWKLVAWARAVKARRRGRFPPPLWLFTDEARMPCLRRVLERLPPGLCGVVFRHDSAPDRAGLLRAVARVCRARRLALSVAGDLAGPAFAGRHLRGGRARGRRGGAFLTSSAHDRRELVRARRAGARLVFVSPAFATTSHPSAGPIGAVRWSALTRRAGLGVLALGGLSGGTARRLPRWAAGVGAIEALL